MCSRGAYEQLSKRLSELGPLSALNTQKYDAKNRAGAEKTGPAQKTGLAKENRAGRRLASILFAQMTGRQGTMLLASEPPLRRLVFEGGFHKGVGAPTHSTLDTRISTNGKLYVPDVNRNALLDVIAHEGEPNVAEHITDHFRMFFEIVGTEELDDSRMRPYVRVAAVAVERFFGERSTAAVATAPTDITSNICVLHAAGPAPPVRARIVFPNIVVDTQRALSMHALFLTMAHERLSGDARRIITGNGDPSNEPCISPKWARCFPNTAYLPKTRLPMAFCPVFEKCSAHSGARCNTCFGAGCVATARALLPLAVYSGTNAGQGDAEIVATEKMRQSRGVTLDATSLRSIDPYTDGFAVPPGCPQVPQKHGERGMCILDVFENERSGLTMRKAHTLVTDVKIICTMLDEVRRFNARYRDLHVISVFRKGTIDGAHVYRVNVGGPNVHYCFNKNGEHTPDEDGGGRVYFELDRAGVHVRCNCRITPPNGKRCCDYRSAGRPLAPMTMSALGFPTKKTEGSFFDNLRDKLLPNLALEARGEVSSNKRKR